MAELADRRLWTVEHLIYETLNIPPVVKRAKWWFMIDLGHLDRPGFHAYRTREHIVIIIVFPRRAFQNSPPLRAPRPD